MNGNHIAGWETIQSEQNQWLKQCKALQQKKNRQQTGTFVAEGLRFVQEALEHGMVTHLFVEEDRTDFLELPVLQQAAAGSEVSCHLVQKGMLAKVLSTTNPQGIAAIVRQPVWDWNALADSRQLLILDGVQDPGNVGTMIRTALASGTEAVLCLKGTVDVYNDKVLRSTMGAIFQMPVFQVENVDDMLADLSRWGYQLAVSDIRAEQYYHQIRFPERTALVVSNEANGPQLIRTGDIMVKIPLYQNAESLNVAIAAGILMYAIRTGREE